MSDTAIGTVRVSDLRVQTTGRRPVTLVDRVTLEVAPGEALGIVGESGSGKSLTLRSVLGLLPEGVRRSGGEVEVGGRVGMVFQDPLTALDPLESVGAQIAEAVTANRGTTGAPSKSGRRRPAHPRSPYAGARQRALELMRAVHLNDPEQRYHWYPHQLSGGQRQRVVIAIALATDPDVLLCDEPTTALDVTVQRQIISLLDDLRRERGITILFVSHNLAVVSSLCQRIVVMRSGRIVESGKTLDVVTDPQSPYTRLLVDSVLGLPGHTPEGGAA